ncbi:hypothetical protein CHUAL_011545 [Chamberlinius hualienensis]
MTQLDRLVQCGGKKSPMAEEVHAADTLSKSIIHRLQDFTYKKQSNCYSKLDNSNGVSGKSCSDLKVKAGCSNKTGKNMDQSCNDTYDTTSEDESFRKRISKKNRIYQLKDSDSEDESCNIFKEKMNSDGETEANAVSINGCSKTGGAVVSVESEKEIKSNDLTLRIQNAYQSLSKRRPRPVIKSSSEDEDGNVTTKKDPSENSLDEHIEDEILRKETCLSKLCKLFPLYDKMEIQDALVESNWSVEIAEENVRKKLNSSNGNNYSNGHSSSKKLKRSREHENSSRKRRKQVFSNDSGDDDDQLYLNEEEEEELYDSDESDVNDTLTPARQMVLKFFETATIEELSCIPYCSKKKAEALMQLRPFTGWLDLVTKFQNERYMNTDLIKSAKDVLNSRRIITKLMRKCEILATELELKVSRLLDGDSKSTSGHGRLNEQPSLLNSSFKLAPYQLLGLNWLILMHRQNVNGILADEMGLGKTIQAISFITYCIEQGNLGPYLIVVPSSIIDNWEREIHTWSPTLNVILYHGSQEFRRYLRMQIINGQKKYNILISTYNLVAGAAEDRVVFKKLGFEYVVFDEAHLLKNMETQRYQHLTKIKAKRRLLLTGTPLQNNLVELMSLLGFLMPNMFEAKIEHLKMIFSMAAKKGNVEVQGAFEKERVDQAKRIMKPFVLRRHKMDVLKELPNKVDDIVLSELSSRQKQLYNELVVRLSKEVQSETSNSSGRSGSGMMMQLRKLANHPLLLRYKYADDKLRKMAKAILQEPTHRESEENLVFEDMQVMSDFELHKLCLMYKSLSSFSLNQKYILDSGKFEILDKLLPEIKFTGDRVLLFSQFVIVLDIVEEYMKLHNYKYLRLDGSTPVEERQTHIDSFTNDDSIFIFLLSTRAGGLGINLAAANVVILHDIDFNPYNDKQAVIVVIAEVKIIRLISKDTIEEAILRGAQNKLKLEKALIDNSSDLGNDNADVASLLKEALGLS